MNNYVSYNKMNKKEQRKIDLSHRNVWNINPISKVKESKKIYNRKKMKQHLLKEI